jgi:DNA-directed RNA polymerase specialized sigma24 family protein
MHSRFSQPTDPGADRPGSSRQTDQTPLPDEIVVELESRAALEAAVSRLDSRCRQLVTWLFLSPDRTSYNDVSRKLGIKPNSLGPLRSRCLAKLRKLLKEMGYEAD